MTKLLLLCFGIMFSLYGYNHLSGGEVEATLPDKTVHAQTAQNASAQSFTERISAKNKQ